MISYEEQKLTLSNLYIFYEKKFQNYYKKFLFFSLAKKILVALFFLLPWIMMIGRALADTIILLIFLSFLIRSIFINDWNWMRFNWVFFSILFWLSGLLSSFLLFKPFSHFENGQIQALQAIALEGSFENGFAWLRFPIFAIACLYWLLKEREIKYFILLNIFLVISTLILISFFEIIFDPILNSNFDTNLTWPFNNPLVGPYISKIGMPFILISIYLYFNSRVQLKITSFIFIISYGYIILMTGNRVGCFSVFLSIFILLLYIKPKLSESIFFITIGIIFLLLFSYLNPNILDRFSLYIFNENKTPTSLFQYKLLWKTSINFFSSNILIGIGPTNFQGFLINNNISVYLKEHPHNHYLQAFTETGLLGGVSYLLMVFSILIEAFRKKIKKSYKKTMFLAFVPIILTISLLWPFANGYDLYGQQQNSFLWYGIVIALSIFSRKTA